MADKTLIAWTDHTWNPWMGCFKVSQGCKNCYADALTTQRMNLDVFGPPAPAGERSRRQRTGAGVWGRPITWNRAAQNAAEVRRVFCASLSDVFEDEVGPNEWRPDVFKVIRETPWLDYQLLTKRPENIERMLPDDWGDGYPNVWLGTSIEDNRVVERAPILTEVPAHVHFVSYEPAIGPLDEIVPYLNDRECSTVPHTGGIEWLIAGGESGPGYRPMDLQWCRDIWRECIVAGTAFFFKQNTGPRTEMGIDALGQIVREFPLDRRPRHLMSAALW